MSKGAKIAVAIMLGIIAIYIIVMLIDTNDIVEEIPKPVDSGENVEQEDELIYSLTKVSDTQIDLTTENENTKTTTRYIFENDKVSNILILEEILSGDLVEEVYNGIKADEEMSQIYDDIKYEGNIITMKLKADYVNVYEGLTYDELFKELSESLEISQE